MTRLAGLRRGEAYPDGGRGGSPIAAMPFVQLGLSASAVYTPGEPTMLIPFDTVVYQSAEFGDFETATDVGSVFTVPFGSYLSVMQIGTTDNDIEFGASVALATSTGQDVGGAETDISAVTVTVTAIRLGSETPFPGTVRPVVVVPSFLPPAAGSPGLISAVVTKLFIWKLQEFVPVVGP